MGTDAYHMEGQLGGQTAQPSQEPNLEVVWNNSLSLRDTLQACHQLLNQMEDFLEGPRPETACDSQGLDKGPPPGIVQRLCLITATSHDELQHLQKRIVGMCHRLGVQI